MLASTAQFLWMFSRVATALPPHTAPPRTNLVGGTALSVAPSLVCVPYPGSDEVQNRALYVSLPFRMRESTAHFQEVFSEVLTALPPHTAPSRTILLGGIALSVAKTLVWIHIQGVTRSRIEPSASPSLSACVSLQLTSQRCFPKRLRHYLLTPRLLVRACLAGLR